jgi:hypothetical protein
MAARDITSRLSIARVSALLSRLDPHGDGRCRVPGCVHMTTGEPAGPPRVLRASVAPGRGMTPRAA